jgi:hypothetical protein
LVDLTVLSQVLACNVIMDNEGDGRGKKQWFPVFRYFHRNWRDVKTLWNLRMLYLRNEVQSRSAKHNLDQALILHSSCRLTERTNFCSSDFLTPQMSLLNSVPGHVLKTSQLYSLMFRFQGSVKFSESGT